MLTRRVGAALYGTLVGKTLLALKKKLLAFTPALAALGIEVSGHFILPKSGAFSEDDNRCAEPVLHPKCW